MKKKLFLLTANKVQTDSVTEYFSHQDTDAYLSEILLFSGAQPDTPRKVQPQNLHAGKSPITQGILLPRLSRGKLDSSFLPENLFPRTKDLPPQESANPPAVYIRNLEQLGLFTRTCKDCLPVLDSSVPIINSTALQAFRQLIQADFYFTASYELTLGELRNLYKFLEDAADRMILPIYGRIPLMVSAGCTKETLGNCDHRSGLSYITDRKGITFPVENDCRECINTIYNSLPYSGHEILSDGCSFLKSHLKLEFTIESPEEIPAILGYYLDLLSGQNPGRPDFEYTTGHLKRRVE